MAADFTQEWPALAAGQQPGDSDEKDQGEKSRRAHRATERSAQVARQGAVLLGLQWPGIAPEAAERTAESIQRQPQCLPVGKATAKYIEQDTEIQCPGNEGTI